MEEHSTQAIANPDVAHRAVTQTCSSLGGYFYLAMLDMGMPFAALIHSGNKSIHGLLAVNCPDADTWTRKVENELFRSNLELLGCDGACKNESRMTRTPGAMRSNGKMQKLLYLNPNLKGN